MYDFMIFCPGICQVKVLHPKGRLYTKNDIPRHFNFPTKEMSSNVVSNSTPFLFQKFCTPKRQRKRHYKLIHAAKFRWNLSFGK